VAIPAHSLVFASDQASCHVGVGLQLLHLWIESHTRLYAHRAHHRCALSIRVYGIHTGGCISAGMSFSDVLCEYEGLLALVAG
jgi:hypothetical protein